MELSFHLCSFLFLTWHKASTTKGTKLHEGQFREHSFVSLLVDDSLSVVLKGGKAKGYQTLVGNIMEMIAATVVGSCWPMAPSSV